MSSEGLLRAVVICGQMKGWGQGGFLIQFHASGAWIFQRPWDSPENRSVGRQGVWRALTGGLRALFQQKGDCREMPQRSLNFRPRTAAQPSDLLFGRPAAWGFLDRLRQSVQPFAVREYERNSLF